MRDRASRTFKLVILDQQGLAAIEFALVAPVLILLLCSMYDVGNWMWRSAGLEMAARAGAQYALARPLDESGIRNTVLSQLTGWTNVTVAPTLMVCKCDDGVAADCTTGTCPSGAATYAPIGYISVTVTQPFQTISPVSAYLFPAGATMRGNVEVRLH